MFIGWIMSLARAGHYLDAGRRAGRCSRRGSFEPLKRYSIIKRDRQGVLRDSGSVWVGARGLTSLSGPGNLAWRAFVRWRTIGFLRADGWPEKVRDNAPERQAQPSLFVFLEL
jgi:hypothetical protein